MNPQVQVCSDQEDHFMMPQPLEVLQLPLYLPSIQKIKHKSLVTIAAEILMIDGYTRRLLKKNNLSGTKKFRSKGLKSKSI